MDAPAETVLEAAFLSEAFDLTEAERPDIIALAVEVAREPGFDMFLHLIDALSIDCVLYGAPSDARTLPRLTHALPYVPFDKGSEPKSLFNRFFSKPTLSPITGVKPIGAPPRKDTKRPSAIVVGASTGGVSALEVVLSGLPADCPPTFVVQHIRAGFVEGMIERLDRRCRPRIQPATDGAFAQLGHVYVAHDSDRHLVLSSRGPLKCRLRADAPRHGHRPSVDSLFESIAGRAGVAAALLTGMGADGAEGMHRIKTAGGLTIAQNEDTCVVYGMPKVAVQRGAADLVLPLDRIADALIDLNRGPVDAPIPSCEVAR